MSRCFCRRVEALRHHRLGQLAPDDVFEPYLIRAALQRDDNLGHLIFGPTKWAQIRGPLPSSEKQDPLTKYFTKGSLSLYISNTASSSSGSPAIAITSNEVTLTQFSIGSCITTHLALDRYTSDNLFQVASVNCPTFLYRQTGSNHPQIWTVVRPPQRAAVTELTEKQRIELLFETIVQTPGKVAVGPLEYCGNGHIIRTGKSTLCV